MKPAGKPSLLYRLWAHLLVFGLCVAMPTLVMLIMPVASTTLTRSHGSVSATVVRKIIFVIPFQTETLYDVIAVDDQYQAGTLSQTTPSGPKRDPMRPTTRSESMSWLILQSKEATVDVPVSPANMDEAQRKVRDFLGDESQPELRLLTVANWKISVITGGVLSLLSLFYVGNAAWAVASFFVKNQKG